MGSNASCALIWIFSVLTVSIVILIFSVGVLTLLSLWSNQPDTFQPSCSEATGIYKGRMTAQVEGHFVVVLIGSAVNSWQNLPHVLFTARAMRQMLKELKAGTEPGFLGAHSWFGNPMVSIQYWRSLDDLHKYASTPGGSAVAYHDIWHNAQLDLGNPKRIGDWRSPKRNHVGAWGRFNRYLKQTKAGRHKDSGVGIFHEAYQVRAGEYECAYSNMPAVGLGRFTKLVAIEDRKYTGARSSGCLIGF
ncbi:hypothetical protein WJX84_005469 [Apatococcus fuscideae]|uniref:DUF4188 domain-containing protein n=1 Tax=Apatococcus fuscideae TaxID=2026836 RepID=A0AAW1T410_9CHLO